jgi:hypothetical protein
MRSQIMKIFTLINSWFTFLLGLIFIFGIGLIYAYLQPEDLWLNIVFLVIALGWVAFTIKYIWDVMDKKRVATPSSEVSSMSQIPAPSSPKATNGQGNKQEETVVQ